MGRLLRELAALPVPNLGAVVRSQLLEAACKRFVGYERLLAGMPSTSVWGRDLRLSSPSTSNSLRRSTRSLPSSSRRQCRQVGLPVSYES